MLEERASRSALSSERVAISLLVALLALLWLGFFVHRSPRFAGSAIGSVFAVGGAILMILPTLAYTLAKHISLLKKIVAARFSIAQVLSLHVYTSVAGAVLAIIHTGHRFESDIGVTLTAVMLLAVVTGYVGRHLLLMISSDVRETQERLAVLQALFNEASSGVVLNQEPVARLANMAESIAELEYAVRSHARLKRWASRWLTVHIALAIAFAVLLVTHIWSGIYFGLRWFD